MLSFLAIKCSCYNSPSSRTGLIPASNKNPLLEGVRCTWWSFLFPLPLRFTLDYLSNTLSRLDLSLLVCISMVHPNLVYQMYFAYADCLFICYSYNWFCPAPVSFADDWWVIHSLAITSNNLCSCLFSFISHAGTSFKALVIIPCIYFSVLHEYMFKPYKFCFIQNNCLLPLPI